MKELLMLGVLGLMAWLLSRSLGWQRRPPLPGNRMPGTTPEREVPMADTPVILDTGGHDGP